MLNVIKLHLVAFAALLLLHGVAPHSAKAWPVHGAGNPYSNACGTQPAGQMWCIGADGWTVFTPVTTGTGSCGATGTFTGTCVTYIAENGTGTSATCRIAATGGFDFTTTIPDAQACPYTTASISLARSSSSDFLLFKRGDCFIDPGQTSPCTASPAPGSNSYGVCTTGTVGCNFARNGISSNSPIVIGSYGSLALPRPRISSTNYGFESQAGSGNNIAVIDLWFDGGYLFSDVANVTYNPGVITAASGSASGTSTITLSSPPPSGIVNTANSNNWSLYNFSNATEMKVGSCSSGMRISSISGATITLSNPIPASWDVTIGDRLVFLPTICGNGGHFNLGTPLAWAYLEGNLFEGAGLALQETAGTAVSFYIRRNVIHDSSSVGTRNQGMFLSDSFNLSSTTLVEENVVDHTGWRQVDADCTPGQFLPSKCSGVASAQFENFYGNPNNQSQNAYDHEDCCFATFNRNILTNASGSGVQVRSGGILYNNFSCRNNTAYSVGGIVWPNTVSYNVSCDLTYSYNAIMKVTGVAGNVLTFASVPQSLISSGGNASQPFNASNPSGISQTTNASFTTTLTTVTIAGPAISASIGDTIYFVGTGGNAASLGLNFDSSWTSPATVSANAANPSNVQWNVATNALSSTYRGGLANSGVSFQNVQARAIGDVFANNFMMNNPSVGLLDQSEIQSIDGNAFCSGQVRLGITRDGSSQAFHVGDSVVLSGVQPPSMNANGSFTVGSVDATPPQFLCLAGSTFGTGSWTSGTGVINGGVAWGPNYYSNVGTPISVAPAAYTQTAPVLQSFTPVGTAGCPQALGCPSIEGYDLSIGGDGTLSHFITGAKVNRKGSWDARFTAQSANHYIRSGTSAAMPNPSF